MVKLKSRNYLAGNRDLYSEHAFLHHEIARRMLDYVEKNDPRRLLNDGAFDHYLTELMRKTFPLAVIDENIKDRASDGYDLIMSNLLLQDIWSFEARIQQYYDQLNAGGRLILTMIGTGSLDTLRSTNGLAINYFPDIEDLGDYMHAIGFQNALLYIEKIHLTYEKIDSLLQDARVVAGRPFDAFKGLRTMRWLARAKHVIEENHTGEYYPLSLEIIYAEASISDLKNRRDPKNNDVYVDIPQLTSPLK